MLRISNHSKEKKNVIADIPKKYGAAPKYRFIKYDPENDIKIVSKEELIRVLEKAHDTVWQGGRLAPTAAFDEVSKLLFCKLKNEKDTYKGKPYKFQIGTHETPEEVFNRINTIYQEAKQTDAEVFREDIRLEAKSEEDGDGRLRLSENCRFGNFCVCKSFVFNTAVFEIRVLGQPRLIFHLFA